GRAPARTDPAIAPVVTLGLLRERLQELPHQLVGGEVLELRQLLGREGGKLLRFPEPLEHLLGHVVAARPLDAPEEACEHPVVGVEVGFALHQTGAREMVETKEARSVEPLLERGEESAPLLDRDRDPLGAESVEQVEEHRTYWL